MIQAEQIAVLITPELAKEWLSLNGLNRPLDKKTVSHYASIMRRGAWMLTGEPIIFGDDGRLLDGQHRLSAIVESGVAVRIVAIGHVPSPNKAFHAIGTGKIRTNAEILSIAGEVNPSDLSTALRAFYIYHSGGSTNKATRKMPSDVMFTILDRHPDFKSWCVMALRLKKCGLPQGTMAVILFGMAQRNKEKAIAFFNDCEYGVNLTATNPALVLRNRLSFRRRTETIPRTIVFAMCIKAANAYIIGKPVQRLTWFSENEPFPELIGYPMDPEVLLGKA